MGIQQLNELQCSDLKSYYVTAHYFDLEKKSTSFCQRLFHWFKRICNPTIYKTENLFKALACYAILNIRVSDPKFRLNLKDPKFQDLIKRIEHRSLSRVSSFLSLSDYQATLNIYNAALDTLNIPSLMKYLEMTDPIHTRLLPGLKMALIALKAQGYDDAFCKSFLPLLYTNFSFNPLLQDIENFDNLLHLFKLIEDLAKAHKKAKLPGQTYKGYISKDFSDFLDHTTSKQNRYLSVDDYNFHTKLTTLFSTFAAPQTQFHK